MSYVLDTNAVSALLRGDPQALERLKTTSRTEVSVPQPVIAEIAYGIERLPRSRRRSRLAARFELLCREIRRVPWDDDVSHEFGRIKSELERRGEIIEDFDIAIAAHARSTGAVLVTADRAHMSRVADLAVEDWLGA